MWFVFCKNRAELNAKIVRSIGKDRDPTKILYEKDCFSHRVWDNFQIRTTTEEFFITSFDHIGYMGSKAKAKFLNWLTNKGLRIIDDNRYITIEMKEHK